MVPVMDKILNFLGSILNSQIQPRLNPHLRAALYGLCLTLTAIGTYRGEVPEGQQRPKASLTRAQGAEVLAFLASVFQLSIKKAEPGNTGISIGQASEAAKPPPGTTAFTPTVTVAKPEGTAVAVVPEDSHLAGQVATPTPMGPEFVKKEEK